MLQLVYRNSEGEKIVIRLDDAAVVTVGREEGSIIRPRNPSVSRGHARIFQDNGRWSVEDLGSSNHSYVNDQRIDRIPIGAGDVLRFGDFRVKVQGVVSPRGSRPRKKAARRSANADDRRAANEQREADNQAKREARSKRRKTDGEAKTAAPPVAEKDAEPTPAGPAAAPEVARKQADSKPAHTEDEAPSPSPPGDDTVKRMETAEQHASALADALTESESRIEELELRCHELELREQRHEEELDGWHDRSKRILAQLEHEKGIRERTREELDEREGQLTELEEKLEGLNAGLAASASSRTESDDQLAELKTKVVQKDRRIDELQRELDLMEYDLRQAREEIEGLQDSFNHDNTEQRRLERELALLREVITEKESVVSQLKVEIETKSREIYDLKVGTGIKDLEEARRDVLEQYFEKNREVDRLAEALKESERLGEAQSARVSELESAAAHQRDIREHPDFQRKEREVERAVADRDGLLGELARLTEKLSEHGPDVKARLEAEMAAMERRHVALESKLTASQAEATGLGDELAAIREEAASTTQNIPRQGVTGWAGQEAAQARLADVMDDFVAWKVNLNLLRTYLEEAADATREGAASDLAMESVDELLTVVSSEAAVIGKELVALKDLLAQG